MNVNYITCKFIIIFNDGSSFELPIHIKNDDKYIEKRKLFKETLERMKNVRLVRL